MGELKKLEIVAYKDNAFSQATGKTFTLMVNPTKYAQRQTIRYSSEEALDGGNNPASKRRVLPTSRTSSPLRQAIHCPPFAGRYTEV